MKKFMTIALALFTTVVFAQDSKTVKKEAVKAEMKHECYMMKDGALFHCMGTDAQVQKTDVTLKNGMVINTSGEVSREDGSSMKLEDGQCISLMGGIGDCAEMHSKMGEMKKESKELNDGRVK